MNRWKNFTAGFLRENPVFSLYLGLCSTLAITTTLNNAIGMGVAVIAVLSMSNVVISLLRNITPKEIRIPEISSHRLPQPYPWIDQRIDEVDYEITYNNNQGKIQDKSLYERKVPA